MLHAPVHFDSCVRAAGVQMEINLEKTMDDALELRVEAAIDSLRWAQLAHHELFTDVPARFEATQASLRRAEATAASCTALAQEHGWL